MHAKSSFVNFILTTPMIIGADKRRTVQEEIEGAKL